MTFRIVFRNPQAGPVFKQRMRDNVLRIARAATAATNIAAKEIQENGRNSIKTSGRFGSRWVQGLKVVVDPKSVRINKTITITHNQPGALLHETGGVILGKPLLWIPLSFSGVKVRAADYPGGLARVNRKGKAPLLISIREHKPIYVGLKSVRVKPRWGIRTIARNTMKQYVSYYNANLK